MANTRTPVRMREGEGPPPSWRVSRAPSPLLPSPAFSLQVAQGRAPFRVGPWRRRGAPGRPPRRARAAQRVDGWHAAERGGAHREFVRTPSQPKTLRPQSSTAPHTLAKQEHNFAKFLVGRDGRVIRRYLPAVPPEALEADILAALAAK